jgi:bifunctional aspartokinase / homoserine dehydrogenase 1
VSDAAWVAPCTNVVLLGIGAIGRELIRQLITTRNGVSPRLRVCGIIDRSGYVFDQQGLPRKALDALCAHKKRGSGLATSPLGLPADPLDAVAFISGQLRNPSVLVDVTAADTHAMLEIVLERGWAAVLANKVPLAAEQHHVDRLHAAARFGGGEILHEATVGAGLPVIDTLRMLIAAGDRVTAIEGCPSGTLGVLFAGLERGERFSDVVRSAVTSGYTEPDPRVDLSGLDVARKALILARMIGFRGDLDGVHIESLVPHELRSVPLEVFHERLGEGDEPWAARVAAARARGAVLRYRARVTRQNIRVGLAEVPISSSLSLLHGTDNQFSFTTARYNEQPLVISGPGAGSSVTAAGVYGDLLRVIDRRAPASTI